MKVKNQGCIRRLSIKTVLAARKRNTIAVLAIALTALLFTSLFTIVLSINETNQGYQFRSVGTSSHGSFKEVTEDQIAALSAHPKVKATGIRKVIGLCTSGAFEKDYGEVSFMEDNTAKWSFAMPTVGRVPKTGREVAMDTKVLAMLGVTPELGAQVDLTYTLADQTQRGDDVTDTFTLVGWWDYDERMAVHYINISREYAQEMEARAIAAGMHPFRTDLNVMLGTSMNIEDTLTRIGEDCGYTVGDKAGQLRIGVNWGYTYTQLADTMDAEGILAMAAILILVTFTGYLVIYNIFQISVAGDIRYYGLLKTIGVTPRQLRRMIRQQALLLCAVGIPLGLLLGYGIGVAAVPVALSASTYESKYTVISISPLDFSLRRGLCPADGAAVLCSPGPHRRECVPGGGGAIYGGDRQQEAAALLRKSQPRIYGLGQPGAEQKEDCPGGALPVSGCGAIEYAGDLLRRLRHGQIPEPPELRRLYRQHPGLFPLSGQHSDEGRCGPHPGQYGAVPGRLCLWSGLGSDVSAGEYLAGGGGALPPGYGH